MILILRLRAGALREKVITISRKNYSSPDSQSRYHRAPNASQINLEAGGALTSLITDERTGGQT